MLVNGATLQFALDVVRTDPNLRVFHVQQPNGKHRYSVGTLKGAITELIMPGKNNVYERLEQGRLARFFMHVMGDAVACRAAVEATRIKVVHVLGDMPEPLEIIHDSPKRPYVRLVWDVWYANLDVCARVAEVVKRELRGLADVDMTVYTLRQVQLVFTRGVRDRLVPQAATPVFDEQVLIKSLIGYHPMPGVEEPVPCEPVGVEYLDMLRVEPELAFVVIRWMQVMNQRLHPTNARQCINGWFSFGCTAYCWNAQRWHARQYVVGDEFGRVTLHCYGCPGWSKQLYEQVAKLL